MSAFLQALGCTCRSHAITSLVIGVIFMAKALPGPTARADEIYGFLGDGAWQTAAGDTRLAQTFSTGGLRMTLDSVQVWVRNANEANSSWSAGTLNLSLYSTDGDRKPTGSSLLTIGSQFFGNNFPDELPTFSNLGYTLSANTTYAVVFQGSSGSTISWKYPGSGSISTTISPTPTFRDWASSNNGGSWSDGAPSIGYSMNVNASNTATPFTWTGGGSSNN